MTPARRPSDEKPSKKPITKPAAKSTVRPTRAHKGPRQGIAFTMSEVSERQSASAPGRMSAVGSAPPNPTPPRTVEPEPPTGEEAPREQPTQRSPAKPPVRRRR